jgi:aspartate kinase
LNEELNKITKSKQVFLEGKDRIVTMGEKLSTIIIEAHLLNNGINCKALWGIEAGIITDNLFNSHYIIEESYGEINNKLNQNFVPVVAGYFGHDKEGKIRTLGRGASDYIATSISAALGCPVFLYKDVDGIMTADPKMVEKPSIIKTISYKDALELSFFGAKIINEKAIMPCATNKIKINIQNFYKNEVGTIISDSGEVNAVCVIGDGLKVDLYNLSIINNEINEVFKEINMLGLHPRLVLMTGRSEVSFIIRKNEIESINEFLTKNEGEMDVTLKDVGIVTLIGKAANSQEVNQINDHLIKNNLSYYLMTQSASRNIMSFIIDNIHIKKTAKLLHNLFVET